MGLRVESKDSFTMGGRTIAEEVLILWEAIDNQLQSLTIIAVDAFRDV